MLISEFVLLHYVTMITAMNNYYYSEVSVLTNFTLLAVAQPDVTPTTLEML